MDSYLGLSRADFISIGLNFMSLHHIGADYDSQELSRHWISVVLHGPCFHPAIVLNPCEHISLLPKKNIPPDINIYIGAASVAV